MSAITCLLFVTVLIAHLSSIFSCYVSYVEFHFLRDVKKREIIQYVTYSFKENVVLLIYSDPKLLLLSYTNILPSLVALPCGPNFTSCTITSLTQL